MKKNLYYLTARSRSTECFPVFEAVFSETCEISGCYIMASSLVDALSTIYDELSGIYGVDYLDTHLLTVKFMRCLPVYD